MAHHRMCKAENGKLRCLGLTTELSRRPESEICLLSIGMGLCRILTATRGDDRFGDLHTQTSRAVPAPVART